MTAAHRLQQEGVHTTVFEAKAWIGGRTRTDTVDAYRVDTYTQLFGSMHTDILRLLDELDAHHLAVRMPGRDAIWRKGRAHEVVYGSIASMLSTGAVPVTTKMRLGTTYLRFLNTHAADLKLHAPERAALAGLDNESVSVWGERELGSDFVEFLAYPLLASYSGVAPEEISAALYHILASSGTDVTMFALRGGIGRICDLIAQRVTEGGGEVRTSAEVRRVEARGPSVHVSGEGWEDTFDGAVLCVPGVEVPLLVPGLSAEASQWFAGVRYHPLASLALLLNSPVGVRYFGLSFTRQDSRVISTVCIEENKHAELVPEGAGLLVVFPAPEAVRLFVDSPPEQVLAAALPDLERVFPGIRSRIRRAKLYRWPLGGPVFYPGYLGHLQTFRQGGVEGDGRIAFAGDYLMIPSFEGSAASARQAAERLLARIL
jgi:protoporphyrinogen oxidase